MVFGSQSMDKDVNVHSFLMVFVSAEKLPVQVYISPKGFIGAALVLLKRATLLVPLINPPWFCMFLLFTLQTNWQMFCVSVTFEYWKLFFPIQGGDVVKIAQLANIAGSHNRISQPETPVTLQFQGNKFTLSPSQLRQLTTGQPLHLQGFTYML